VAFLNLFGLFVEFFAACQVTQVELRAEHCLVLHAFVFDLEDGVRARRGLVHQCGSCLAVRFAQLHQVHCFQPVLHNKLRQTLHMDAEHLVLPDLQTACMLTFQEIVDFFVVDLNEAAHDRSLLQVRSKDRVDTAGDYTALRRLHNILEVPSYLRQQVWVRLSFLSLLCHLLGRLRKAVTVVYLIRLPLPWLSVRYLRPEHSKCFAAACLSICKDSGVIAVEELRQHLEHALVIHFLLRTVVENVVKLRAHVVVQVRLHLNLLQRRLGNDIFMAQLQLRVQRPHSERHLNAFGLVGSLAPVCC